MAFIRSYSRGDPGLGSWLKKAAKIVMPVASLAQSKMGRSIGGMLPGGGILAKANTLLSAGGLWKGKSRTELMSGATGLTLPIGFGQTFKQLGGKILGGAAQGFAQGLAERAPTGVVVTDPQTGYEYIDYSGKARKKYRRMNVCNVKALRRSIRRVKGFSKIARESIVIASKVKAKKRGKR